MQFEHKSVGEFADQKLVSRQTKKRKFHELNIPEQEAPLFVIKIMKVFAEQEVQTSYDPRWKEKQNGEFQEEQLGDPKEILPYNKILPYSAYKNRIKDVLRPIMRLSAKKQKQRGKQKQQPCITYQHPYEKAVGNNQPEFGGTFKFEDQQLISSATERGVEGSYADPHYLKQLREKAGLYDTPAEKKIRRLHIARCQAFNYSQIEKSMKAIQFR